MTDPTAGRSAGTPLNAELDPMGRSDEENCRSALEAPEPAATERTDDPMAGRSAGTRWNPGQDPTMAADREPEADLPAA